ncbi:MAG: hypothetical protein BMS9Abin05_1747 [Rhodothermia bacterium]|nr:MAG: hypothetical protein BMS9Abin05_1747 [Rhodothermia bacterium]
MRKARLMGQACASLLLIVLLGAPSVQAQISVDLPSLTAGVGETISVPVDISNVEATGSFNSFQFRVISSSANLVFIGEDKTGTLSDKGGWSVASGVPNNTLVGGFSSSDSSIVASGTLVNLMFRLDAVDVGITVELQEFKLQSGAMPLVSNPEIPATQLTVATDAEDETTLPGSFVLRGNYPNPFNPTTNIQFDLPQTSEVEISIMDILGREMLTIPSQTLSAGAGQTVAIDANSLASGIYIYRVIARSGNDLKVASGTMTLIK